MIYKTQHNKLKIDEHEPRKNRRCSGIKSIVAIEVKHQHKPSTLNRYQENYILTVFSKTVSNQCTLISQIDQVYDKYYISTI
jgi:phosphomevalonate kinase